MIFTSSYIGRDCSQMNAIILRVMLLETIMYAICMSFTPCDDVCMLSVCFLCDVLYAICMLFVCYLYAMYLFAICMLFVCYVFVCYLYATCMLFVCYLYATCIAI